MKLTTVVHLLPGMRGWEKTHPRRSIYVAGSPFLFIPIETPGLFFSFVAYHSPEAPVPRPIVNVDLA